MPTFDAQRFEVEATAALQDITTEHRTGAAKKKTAKSKSSKAPTKKRTSGISDSRKMLLHLNAQHWLKQSALLKIICPGLKGVERNMTKVLGRLITLLVPLSLAKAVPVPLEPYAYAMLAFVVCKFGIDVLCAHHK